MTLNVSVNTTPGKRSYSRPTPETWQEATDLFLSGGFTLAELAHRFGVSTRAIQIHAQRRRASAAKRAPPLGGIAGIAATATKLTKATHEACIDETKASAYDDAVTLQTMIADALATLARDPSVPPTGRLRACDQAAVALERTHKLRRTVLGMLREDDAAERPLPELPIRMLTDDEVTAIRNKQAREDGELPKLDRLAVQDSEEDVSGDDHGDVIDE